MEKNKPYNFKSPQAIEKLQKASKIAFEFNNSFLERTEQKEILSNWLGKIEENSFIKPPFQCDFGSNIYIGKNTIINVNNVMFDRSTITFGDNVMVGPNCSFYTSIHPIDFKSRNEGLMISKPIEVGNNVWIAANVVVLPGVKIEDGTVIGAGSVVVEDVKKNTVVAGNPAKVIKKIDQSQVDNLFNV